MPKTRLEAVDGRCLPVIGKRAQFYGMKQVADDAKGVIHRVPGGHAYAASGPFEVEARPDGYPRDQYLRRALLRGDVRKAAQKPPGNGKKPGKSGEEPSR